MEGKEYRKVIDYVQQLLQEDRLRIGQKLPTERELADEIGVGRYSVREGLRIMENMGVIESIQGSGNYLSGNIRENLLQSLNMFLLMKQTNYHEIIQLRRAIEIQMFRNVAGKISENLIDQLKTLLTQMEKEGSPEDAVLDKKFHDILLEASGNQLMIGIMQALSNVCQDLITHVLASADSEMKNELFRTHWEILHALENNDPDKGYREIHKHYDCIEKINKSYNSL